MEFQCSFPWEPPAWLLLLPQSPRAWCLAGVAHWGWSELQSPSVLTAQAQPPAPARAGHWFSPGISPAIPVHLLQLAPKITWTRIHLSHCFCHESGQNFSSSPFNILENHLWSLPLLQIPLLSSWYRKGRPEMWLHSWRGHLLCQPACISYMQNLTS